MASENVDSLYCFTYREEWEIGCGQQLWQWLYAATVTSVDYIVLHLILYM